MPNFVVIGAAKSGTDALCDYLGHHPDVYMCPNREPNFFVAEGQHHVPYRGPGDRAWLEPAMWTSTLDRYQSLFSGVTCEHAIGEGTADYLYSDHAALRIKRYIPEAKLIAVLRNPVDRAYSAYSMLLGTGREPITSFSKALAAEEERRHQNWEPMWHYAKMGFYASQLKRYYQLFDPTQVRVVLYDDFDARPGDVLHDLFGFLGVDAGFMPDTSTRHNVSLVPRNRAVHKLTVGRFLPRTALKAFLPGRVRRSLRDRVLERNLVRPPPVEPEIRHQLVEVFRSEIIELGAILGCDLGAWLR